MTTSKEDICAAAKILKAGGIVAFPTETVYGLGADALNACAVQKIYDAKGRPGDNPVIVHIAKPADIRLLAHEPDELTGKLIQKFWPGPLTLILKKKREVPAVTTGGLETVAVRMPDDKTALSLIEKAGLPIAAPSANISGKPSPTKAAHVIEDMTGKADAIIAGGDCRVGIESTVLDVTGEIPVILRPGIITEEDIKAVTGGMIDIDPSLFMAEDGDITPRSPGMKYRHYAPDAEMIIIEGRRDKVEIEIERLRKLNEAQGKPVGVILFEEKAFEEAAREFFAKLRKFDSEGVGLILAGAMSEDDGVGFAVMNRMLKSAGHNIVKV